MEYNDKYHEKRLKIMMSRNLSYCKWGGLIIHQSITRVASKSESCGIKPNRFYKNNPTVASQVF